MSSGLTQQDVSAVPFPKYRQQPDSPQQDDILPQYARLQQQPLWREEPSFPAALSPSQSERWVPQPRPILDQHGFDRSRLLAPHPDLQQALFAHPQHADVDVRARRLSEPAKFIPVCFLAGTMLMLYLIYVFSHGLELLQLDTPRQHRDGERRQRGIVQLAVFHVLTVLLVSCYVRSVLTLPGGIPEHDPRWNYIGEAADSSRAGQTVSETKKSGQRRHCKWCAKFKPDRCHHCRVCRTCVLKMDHHCPWIYNCVGFRNQKFFWLFLFYAVSVTNFIVWTMMETLWRSITFSAPFVTMFIQLFGVTLACFLAFLLLGYFGFHVWLLFNALTTIEFCEKATKVSTIHGGGKKKSSYNSMYNIGPYTNICSVLGDNPLVWFLPINPASGDGLTFPSFAEPASARQAGDGGEADVDYRYGKHVA